MNAKHPRFVVTACVFSLGVLAALPLLAETGGKTPAPAKELIDAALKTAKAQDKAVMVDFSASWCVWCKRLDAFLHAPEVGKLMADNYVFVTLTVQENGEKKALENPGAEQMMKDMRGSGLPFYFFLDKDGKKLADSLVLPDHQNLGFPGNAEEIKAFGELLERTAPHMTREQRTMITEYLAKSLTKAVAPAHSTP